MSAAASRHDIERELDRVVDRLTSMPLARAAAATEDVAVAARELLAQCRLVDPQVPADASLPALAPQGLGPLIAVLGNDWLAAASSAPAPDLDAVLDILVRLRRSLP